MNQYPPTMLMPQWHTDLCDCATDINSCCEVIFCPYCQIGHQYSTIHYNRAEMDPCICWGIALIDPFLFHLPFVITNMTLRFHLLTKYGIQEDCDCCKAFLCPHLSACQVYRELCFHGQYPGGVCVSGPPPMTMMSGTTPYPPYAQQQTPVAYYPQQQMQQVVYQPQPQQQQQFAYVQQQPQQGYGAQPQQMVVLQQQNAPYGYAPKQGIV